jgi:DNA-binding transcriptional MerR regulator
MAKMFYTIGEVAEQLDIPVTTVRFWEKNFDILRPQKTSAGHRKFTPADIENLKVIYHLVKEKGMTLEGARQRLRENPSGTSHDQEIVDRLLGVRALLEEIRQELGCVPAQGEYLVSEEPTHEPSPEAAPHEPVPQILEQTLF